MALIIADRVKETTASTGTGTLALSGAMTGFKTFASRCSVGDTCYYAIQAVDSGGGPSGDWECGLGTYSAANTLTRTTVTASSNADAAVSFSAGTKQVYISVPAVQAAWPRERLTAARTYYVSTAGNDSNSGLSVGTPFLTIQKACDVASVVDGALQQITIQLADGTYSVGAVIPPMKGSLPLIIRGNLSTPANVHVTVTGTCFLTTQASAYAQVLDMKLTSTSLCLSATPYGFIEFGNIVFGTASARHVNAQYHGHINAIGDYTIAGGGQAHAQASNGGTIRLVSRTITLTGSPAFSSGFAVSTDTGASAIQGNTFSGSATGPRYNASMNGVVSTAGATLPGSTAGAIATGGQYA